MMFRMMVSEPMSASQISEPVPVRSTPEKPFVVPETNEPPRVMVAARPRIRIAPAEVGVLLSAVAKPPMMSRPMARVVTVPSIST